MDSSNPKTPFWKLLEVNNPTGSFWKLFGTFLCAIVVTLPIILGYLLVKWIMNRNKAKKEAAEEKQAAM